MIDFPFILNSLLLGLGLTMDAFSVSLANGLNEKDMKKRKAFGIAGTFAFFQGLMPMIGFASIPFCNTLRLFKSLYLGLL